jgi:flagellar biosynthetic protein FliR
LPSLTPLIPHLVPFLLVLFRLGGLFIFAPMIGSPVVPVRVRTLIALIFAVGLYPTLAASPSRVPLDLFSIGFAAFFEVLIGAGIGLIAALPMYAVQLGGQVGGQQLGLGLAGIYNPAVDTESDVFGQLLLYVALSIFAAMGGLELAFISVAHTFGHIPPGEAWANASVLVGGGGGHGRLVLGDLMLGLVTSGFDVALRISTPILGIILLETLATAFLMKTIPQLNIMSIGFGTKVILGLFILTVSVGALSEVIGDDVRHTCDAMVRWAAGDPLPLGPTNGAP